ncbi:hypothetical protein GOV09_05170 [Candidatus Woesearchaeota archaeon]|nr:hypothetical protein [Candidatus Woesearchaeota archaeon]
MKQLIALLLILAVVLTACGPSQVVDETQETIEETEGAMEETTEELDQIAEDEVDIGELI